MKQKQAAHIKFNKDKLAHSKFLFENLNSLNAYQINRCQYLDFMHKFINDHIQSKFNDHKYPTNFSQSSFNLRMYSLNTIKYYIFNRGSKLWNNVINKEGKNILFCLSKEN